MRRLADPRIRAEVIQRLACGQSQNSIAKIVGITQQNISRFANKEEIKSLIKQEQARLVDTLPDAVENDRRQQAILPEVLQMLQRCTDKLTWLSENVEIINTLPLAGELSGLFKLKVGDYRAIYELNHNKKVITVHKIGHRRDIYK